MHQTNTINPIPAISFLVCTRNRADIVHQCVLNLLKSTRRDFEVIVRDNCSTDNTVDLLNCIHDKRLKIYSASENQGTLTFYEASKLANGSIVTWLSDEDDFQFDSLDFILEQFRQDQDCNVMFGSVIVGPMAHEVKFPTSNIMEQVEASIIALSFSGCGGLFIRRTAIQKANSFNVRNLEDAYVLWNYYPIGFFASRCVANSIKLTSQVVVVQARFASTTHNWSKISSSSKIHSPHYYPHIVFDRLVTNIVNVCFKPQPLIIKVKIIYRLVAMFIAHTNSYVDPRVHALLRENYSAETVQTYLDHINEIHLDKFIGRYVWSLHKLILMLPSKFFSTYKYWQDLK